MLLFTSAKVTFSFQFQASQVYFEAVSKSFCCCKDPKIRFFSPQKLLIKEAVESDSTVEGLEIHSWEHSGVQLYNKQRDSEI